MVAEGRLVNKYFPSLEAVETPGGLNSQTKGKLSANVLHKSGSAKPTKHHCEQGNKEPKNVRVNSFLKGDWFTNNFK